MTLNKTMLFTLPGFTLTQLINEGGNSVIYRGIRNYDNKKVIIKFLTREHSPENIIQFRREYQIQESLMGDGIVKTIGFENTANIVVIIMADDNLESLIEYIPASGFSLEDFFKIAIQITQVLEKIHSHHIIHKDINPYNILSDKKFKCIKIIDFGISSILLKEEVELQNLKKLEGMLGYISPEQTGRMNRLIDYRTDFYSLGITFYEMLTGKLPFKEMEVLELVHSHIATIPKSIYEVTPSIPKILSDIIDKLIAKIPEERYRSCAGLREDLIECQRQWLQQKKINAFPLGEKDIRDELIFSQKIYGREKEIHHLLELVEKSYSGENICLFIKGYSGIGKTTLVKEIYKPITQKSGFFISGKFDQLQKIKPYSAFIEAFNGLVHYLLTESEENLKKLKMQIMNSIGNTGKVLTDIIPDLEHIIGPQLPVPILNPVESQDRFLFTLQNFIRSLAKKEHPLVIFLDDLQWIDNSSLHLLEALITNKDLKYFFFIGAYRDNEVKEDHLLAAMLKFIKKEKAHPYEITINPLTLKQVNHFLADSFNLEPTAVMPLAEIVFNKTEGNPFFINEFLRQLHNEKLLFFSYHDYQWHWELDKIHQQNITDNVIDLLISRIFKLSLEAQNILTYAACIGHIFDLKTLSLVSEKSTLELSKILTLAIQSSFIIPINKNHQYIDFLLQNDLEINKKIEYRFQHDKVQQAAYQLMTPEKKEAIHLQIARLLLKNKDLKEYDEKLFEIVNHFNEGLALIADKKELLKIVEFNLWAGKKAKAATAYKISIKYLQTGLNLLKELPTEDIQSLYFELTKEKAISLFLDREYEESERIFQQLLQKAHKKLSLVEVYKLNCQMFSAQGKHQDALKLGLKALKELGIYIPLNPSKFDILKILTKIGFFFWRNPIKTLELKPIQNEKITLILELIGQIGISARFGNENFFSLIVFTTVYLSLRYGYNKNTTAGGYTLASFVLHRLGNYKKAMALLDFYSRTEQKYGLAESKAKLKTILALTIDPWRLPLEKCIENVDIAYQYCIEESSYFYAFICSSVKVLASEMMGSSIPELRKMTENIIHFLKKNKQYDYLLATEVFQNRYAGYENKDNPISFFEKNKEIILQISIKLTFNYTAPILYCIKDYYMFEKYDEALFFAKKLRIQNQKLGFVADVLVEFYIGLTLLSKPENLSTKDKRELKKIHKKLKKQAKSYKNNFDYYLVLFEAEYARMQNHSLKASQCYHDAIQIAEKQKNTFNIGFASQRAAYFYESVKLFDIAKMYFINAHTMYKKWGSVALCKLIENNHPELFVGQKAMIKKTKHTTSMDSHASSIDVLSLLQATQAISSEIQLDVLLQKLILVLLKNAGAQRGMLIMQENTKNSDSWYVAVEGTIAAQQISLKKDMDIMERSDLPLSMVRYVLRTQQPILTQSDAEFEPYRDDPYIKKIKPQSVIILPLHHQGQFKTLLFLENRSTSHAFTAEHIHTIKVLSAQSIISLENAKLYYQATHDPLTGLANRNLLYQMFPLAVGRAKRSHKLIGVLFLDLDGFKKINDNLGHEIGDKLLIQFAERLKFCIREGDLAVRLGGDEFVAILEDADHTQIARIAERILSKNDPIIIQDHAISIKTSIGMSVYPDHAHDIQTLLKQADIALYRVKEAGKGAYQFYTADHEKPLRKELESTLKRNEFS